MLEPARAGTVVIDKHGSAYQLEDWTRWGDGMCWFIAGNWEGFIRWSEIEDPKVIWEPEDA